MIEGKTPEFEEEMIMENENVAECGFCDYVGDESELAWTSIGYQCNTCFSKHTGIYKEEQICPECNQLAELTTCKVCHTCLDKIL